MPAIFADFNNRDEQGRLRLNCVGTGQDLLALGLELREGLEILCTDRDELEVEARVTFSREEGIWVGEYDGRSVRQRSSDSRS
ncbi:MAG: hypothetical protein JNM84_20235 [Planctomycetes bacterium]|nr:hypothetical protein [Planctomycetota bacterium]